MDIITEIQQTDEEKKFSRPAKRLMEKLKNIPSREEEMSRRWFWELLQNARDYNEQVSVKLNVFDDKIEFLHNGRFFHISDVLNLISPDSDKDEEQTHKDNIGQFGSGFISTHILSSEISVEGIVKSKEENKYHLFKLSLDRENYADKNFLIESTSVH